MKKIIIRANKEKFAKTKKFHRKIRWKYVEIIFPAKKDI